MGVRGILNGRTYTAFFTATRTNVIFENVSATPAVFGPAPSTFILGQRAAGTVSVQTAPPTSPSQSGTVTIDLTCTAGAAATGAAVVPVAPVTSAPAAAPGTVSVAPAAQVATGSAPASPSGNGPWGVGLSVLALATAAVGLAARQRGIGATAAPTGRQQSDPRTWSRVDKPFRRIETDYLEPPRTGFQPTTPTTSAPDAANAEDRRPIE